MDHKWLFSWNLAKAELVSCQSGLSFTHRPAVSTSKIIHHGLCFPFPCSHPRLLCSLCLFQFCSPLLFSPFLWQEILTIAGQCLPPSQEAAGSGLAESECSAPVGVCQQLANKGCCSLTSKALLHTWQTGGQESEYSYHYWGCWGFEVGRLRRMLD